MADETPVHTIAGRKIAFKSPTDAQLLVLGRLLRTSRTFIDAKEEELDKDQIRGGVERMSVILDIIDSLVVVPADRDWLEARIIDGTLDMTELMGALGKDEEPTNRATKRAAAKKSTSRARSR